MTTDLQHVFILLVVFQVKHYLGDFPLQVRWMLNKIADGWEFFLPLACHCSVHGAMTLLIVLVVNPHLWWLAGVDMVIHFFLDRLKAGRKYLGRFNDRNKSSYWNALGFDQMAHHFTSFYIIWVLLKGTP